MNITEENRSISILDLLQEKGVLAIDEKITQAQYSGWLEQHKKTFEEMKKKHDFLDLFDGGIVSAYEHIIKPDERIYKLILERYHLKAEECLFIDDSLTNIHVAQHLGIDGIHLKYGTDLNEELTKKHIL